MVASNTGSAPAELPKQKPAAINCGPMLQQDTVGVGGHQMHPQEFVRLIGCHDSGKPKQEAGQLD